MIKENKQWTVSQCDARSRKMDGQPIGVSGEALGAVVVVHVVLDINIKKIKESKQEGVDLITESYRVDWTTLLIGPHYLKANASVVMIIFSNDHENLCL